MSLSRKLMARQRIIMRPKAEVLQGLLQLGRYNHTSARSGLARHQHRQAMEICFLVRGRQSYTVDEKQFYLRGGDVFLTFPDEIHSTGGMPQEVGILYWMILGIPKNGVPFLSLPEREKMALIHALMKLPSRHFRGSWKLKEQLDSFTRLYHEQGGALRFCAMANLVVAFLLEIIACSKNPVPHRQPHSLSPILNYIKSHLGDNLSVPELSRRAGLSEARFKVRFKQETGVPPGEYVQRARIVEARRRLASGETSITRMAFDLGFSSSQYFSTVFKRFTGMQPNSEIPAKSNQSLRGCLKNAE